MKVICQYGYLNSIKGGGGRMTMHVNFCKWRGEGFTGGVQFPNKPIQWVVCSFQINLYSRCKNKYIIDRKAHIGSQRTRCGNFCEQEHVWSFLFRFIWTLPSCFAWHHFKYHWIFDLDNIGTCYIDHDLYRVTHLLANLGWVDFDLEWSTILLSRFCQIPTSPSRIWQTVEQLKSMSTQPRFARRWVTL